MLAAAATLFAAYLLRNDIFQTLQDPRQPFQTYEKPPAPDFMRTSSWMAWPRDMQAADADVFVVVPEVYKGSEHWNLPVEDKRRREKLLRIVRPNYVDPYRDAGRLFAPYYRQAALYAFLNNREDSRSAQALAYDDVSRAFDVFLSRSGADMPIVLVGHGQGAAHAQRLLQERFGADLRRRLVVAYIIDHPMPAGNAVVPVCETVLQTGCVVAWSAIMPGEEERAARMRKRTLIRMGGRYEAISGRDVLCVNPLSWTRDNNTRARELHKGGVSAIGFEPELRPTVHPAQVGAQCLDGLLQVDSPRVASLRRPRKIGGKFRTLPSNLFYEDLRLNARDRVQAYLTDRKGRRP